MILIGRGLDLKEIRRKDFQRIEEASEDLRSFEVEKEGCPGQAAERRTTACAVLRVRKARKRKAESAKHPGVKIRSESASKRI